MFRSFCALVVGAASAACSPVSDPTEPTHVAYEGCPADEEGVVCDDGLACIQTDLVNVADGTCSQECDVANDCPDDPDGRTKICEQPGTASTKLCYVTCPSASSTCPNGMVCLPTTTPAGTALQVCVPRD
jgi:hypothetical protein